MTWDEYFFKLVEVIASKSKDRSIKFGALIIGPNNEIRSTGYNGFPRGVNDNIESRHERPEKYHWTEHAERNAIYNAARMGISLNVCTIYVNGLPCPDCARAIIQAGITKVIVKQQKTSDPKSMINDESIFEITKTLFSESKVMLIFYY